METVVTRQMMETVVARMRLVMRWKLMRGILVERVTARMTRATMTATTADCNNLAALFVLKTNR